MNNFWTFAAAHPIETCFIIFVVGSALEGVAFALRGGRRGE